MFLDDIVKVNVTTNVLPLSQAGFGVPLIMTVDADSVFLATEKVREYSSPSAMLTDGFLVTDEAYKMALALTTQKKSPSKFLIGKMASNATEELVFTFTGSLTSGTVKASVYGVEYSAAFATDQDTTMSALATAILANLLIDTAVWDDTAKTLTLTTYAGAFISARMLEIGDFTESAKTYTAKSSTIAADLLAIDSQRDDWYALLIDSRSRSDILEAVAQTKTREKLFGFDLCDESVLVGSDDTDLGSLLKSTSEGRVIWMYSTSPDYHYVASWFGRMLPETPGAANWAYKTLVGVPSYKLTSSEQTAINDKRGNMYEEIGGINVPYRGALPDGSFVDLLRGTDLLIARIQEAVFELLATADKVPYTDAGFSLVASAVYSVLLANTKTGLLVRDDFLGVSYPKLSEISAADKAARHLPDVKFKAHLQGAVNTVAIDGVLTLP